MKPYILRLQDELNEANKKLENYQIQGDSLFKEVVFAWKKYKNENKDRSIVNFLDWCSDHE